MTRGRSCWSFPLPRRFSISRIGPSQSIEAHAVIPGWSRRTRPQMCNGTSAKLLIPGSLVSLAPGNDDPMRHRRLASIPVVLRASAKDVSDCASVEKYRRLSFSGNDNVPRIANQREDYLARTLAQYK